MRRFTFLEVFANQLRRLPIADWCSPSRTGFQPLPDGGERDFSFWSINASSKDGKVVDAKREIVATIRVCLGPTNELPRQNFYAEINMNGTLLQGKGECKALKINYPEVGLFPVHCFALLDNLKSPYIGGVLTTNTITSKNPYGPETDPPGYDQASIATLRLWRSKDEQ